jgi:hypothetical protein
MVGEAILPTCHVLNRVPTENKEYENKSLNLSYLCTWACLAKVTVPINKKLKLGHKLLIMFSLVMLFTSLNICS